jgi:hypothetical protein
MKASRILISTFYTYSGKFEQDPAYGIPHLPALQIAKELRELDGKNDSYGFSKTRMVREANKVNHWLEKALKLIEEAQKIALP